MIRALSIAIAVLTVGCVDKRDPDAIDLKTALENTEKGEYSLIAISEGFKFVSFQKAWDHKKQYYYEDDEREAVFKRVAETVKKARKNGHKIGTMGLHEYLEE